MKNRIEQTLERMTDSFLPFLNQDEEVYLAGIAGVEEEKKQEILAFKDWDWFQGVGLYGYFANYEYFKREDSRNAMVQYYERQIGKGLPPKNINSVCPMLGLTLLWEKEKRADWLPLIEEWADWLMTGLPKTEEGGFQHVTAEGLNTGQIWDDTLFVAVLFLAKAGRLLRREEYKEAAIYQFLLHEHYLADQKTGLWYHGFHFEGRHNFGKVFWARGNCWITMAIPELLVIVEPGGSVRDYLLRAYRLQVEALSRLQDSSGLWHTVLDDKSSYLEASGSAGIGAGILRGVELGLLDRKYRLTGQKPLDEILRLTDQDGLLNQVSIGTPVGMNREFYKQIPQSPMAYGQALGMIYLLRVLKTQ